MGLRVTISLSLVPYSPQGMARYRLPSGLSTSLTGYAANCRPYNYHIGQINIGLPLVLASATVGHVYVSVLRSTGVRHGDRHGEREGTERDGRKGGRDVCNSTNFFPATFIPPLQRYIYIKLSRWRTTQRWRVET